jgi:hypothetical protein
MLRSLSPVTSAAVAAILAMTVLVAWSSCAELSPATGCFGPGCEDAAAADTHRPLGLIDL